jgi:alkylhydroperoxidase/carboxymuconolactone decarboxylase family protein YurZ
MTDQPRQVGGGRRAIGDIAPKLAALTDDVLFDDVWNRAELSARDRSLITVTALVVGGTPTSSRTTLAGLSRTASHGPSFSRPSPTWRSMPAGPKQ